MPVSVQTPYNSSTANGVTTVFPYTFYLLSEDDLIVELDGVAQVSGFTVSGVGDPSGGSITFSVAPANGVKVLRKRELPLSRETDYQYQGDFQEEVVDRDFDRIWMAIQQLGQKIISAIKLPFDTATDQVLSEDAADRTRKALMFDDDGNLTLSEFDPDELPAQAEAFADAAAASATAAATSESNAAASEANAATHEENAEAAAIIAQAAAAAFSDGDKGDITVSGAGSVWTLNSDAVPDASTTQKGVSELATSSEMATGTDSARVPSVDAIRQGLVVIGTPQNTTSGTSIDITGFPSWMTNIIIMWSAGSTNGTSPIIGQLGDSGGFETTGYAGPYVSSVNSNQGSGFSSTAGLNIGSTAADSVMHVVVHLVIQDPSTNTWMAQITTSYSNTAASGGTSCTKSLSGALTSFRLTTVSGTPVFDAGTLNWMGW